MSNYSAVFSPESFLQKAVAPQVHQWVVRKGVLFVSQGGGFDSEVRSAWRASEAEAKLRALGIVGAVAEPISWRLLA